MNSTYNTKNPTWLFAGIGATIETFVRQPLMAVSSVAINQTCSTLDAIKSVYRNGGIGKFYSGMQGLTMGLSQRAFHRMGTFAMNEKMKAGGHNLMTISTAAAAFEVACTMVGENFLTTAQTDKKTRSIGKILHERYQKYGLRSFTVGMSAAMGRNTIFNMCYFGTSYFFPELSKEHPMLSAAVAGSSAVVSSHSFEILRVEKTVTPERSYGSIVVYLWKRHGPNALLKGVVPRLSSAGLGSAIALSVYQKLNQ